MTESALSAPPELGKRIMARLDELTRFSAEEGALTRLYLTPEHKAAADTVLRWMAEAGMSVRMDAIGNVVGRYEASAPGAKTLLTGSHIDTVRNAGAYDGTLGVALPIACIEALHAEGKRLPFAIEVIAFGDEEGIRFPQTLSGSMAVAGRFDPDHLDLPDADGVSLADALRRFGGEPEAIGSVARAPGDVLGFVETHIEQGPVLEAENLPVGIVTGINAASRLSVTVQGVAGHAGTVPMGLRRDALAGAAEMVGAVEAAAGRFESTVATVGTMEVLPGAVNVIPGTARFSIDLRAPSDAARDEALAAVEADIQAIARKRHLEVDCAEIHRASATACDPALMAKLDSAVETCGIRPRRLVSGAGHDAMALAHLCPVAMLFVRCAGGISHNPAESITEQDADAAARVFLAFLEAF